MLNTIVSSVGKPSELKLRNKSCDRTMNTIRMIHLYGSSDLK